MKVDFAEAMRLATLSTRANDVVKATKIILHAVTGRPQTAEDDTAFSNNPAHGPKLHSTLRLINPDPERVEASPERQPSSITPKTARPATNFGAVNAHSACESRWARFCGLCAGANRHRLVSLQRTRLSRRARRQCRTERNS